MDTKTKELEKVPNEDRPGQPGDIGATPPPSYLLTPAFPLEKLRHLTVDDLRPYFKDSRGKWRTANLFVETCEDPAKYPPVYTLGDNDTSFTINAPDPIEVGCVSIRRIYMDMEDVTEYKFATLLFGDWDHWLMLNESFVLKPYIENMRRDLDLKLRHKYLNQIQNIAYTGDGQIALRATQYLLETTTNIKGAMAPKRGRPSKEEKEAALQREIKSVSEIESDMKRLGIKVIK